MFYMTTVPSTKNIYNVFGTLLIEKPTFFTYQLVLRRARSALRPTRRGQQTENRKKHHKL